MDELRWLLLIIGVLLIAGVYGYGYYQEGRGGAFSAGLKGLLRRGRKRESHREHRADFDRALDELDGLVAGDEDDVHELEPLSIEPDERAPRVEEPAASTPEPRRPSPEPASEPERKPEFRRPEPEKKAEPRQPEADPTPVGEEKIVVLNVVAPEGEAFTGPAVVEALESAGLRLGEHDIFQRSLETRSGTVALFSVANILEPGSFDMHAIENFQTPGLAFFLRLPGPYDGLAAFEQMHGCAKAVSETLGGRLLDSRRCNLTNQAVEHIREELIEHRRRAHLAARQAR